MDPIFSYDFHRFVLQDLANAPPPPKVEPVKKFELYPKKSEKSQKSKKESNKKRK